MIGDELVPSGNTKPHCWRAPAHHPCSHRQPSTAVCGAQGCTPEGLPLLTSLTTRPNLPRLSPCSEADALGKGRREQLT